jgi:hypothetical protein
MPRILLFFFGGFFFFVHIAAGLEGAENAVLVSLIQATLVGKPLKGFQATTDPAGVHRNGPQGMPRILLFFFGGLFFFVHIANWQLGTHTPTSLRPVLFSRCCCQWWW